MTLFRQGQLVRFTFPMRNSEAKLSLPAVEWNGKSANHVSPMISLNSLGIVLNPNYMTRGGYEYVDVLFGDFIASVGVDAMEPHNDTV